MNDTEITDGNASAPTSMYSVPMCPGVELRPAKKLDSRVSLTTSR